MEDVRKLEALKPPLFNRENSDPQLDTPSPRLGRFVSADSALDHEKKRRNKSGRSKKSSRSKSASATSTQFMSPLSFENIDLGNTPLSSLRSCSEYNRVNSGQFIPKAVENEVRKSFWSTFFMWGSAEMEKKAQQQAANNKRKQQRVRFRSRDSDEQTFLVENLRFNEANLIEGEDYDYRQQQSNSSSSSRPPSCFTALTTTKSSFPSSPNRRKSSGLGNYSIFQDTSMAFDYLLGIKINKKEKLPMEIELKTLKEPQYFTVHAEGSAAPNLLTAEAEMGNMRRVTSFRTLERVVNEADLDVVERIISNRSSRAPSESGVGATTDRVLTFSVTDRATWQPSFEYYWTQFVALLRIYMVAPREDEIFYESIRLQPFSSGGYLRGMLLAGLSSMIFQIYNIVTWPDILRPLSSTQNWVQTILLVNLGLQILFNVFQLPLRLRVHFLCWEASRAMEVDIAVQLIRTMLSSDAWLLNKVLGRCIDFLAVLNLLVTEFYLYCYSATLTEPDPIRNVVISLCATNLLTFVCRIVVATTYSLSMHDPQVLSEARRRGLSKWDLQVLPTFVFSCKEDVTTEDCSICLCCFDLGEMLISLPCDKKHSFHANCIRQWLQRQNSCPLCQRMV